MLIEEVTFCIRNLKKNLYFKLWIVQYTLGLLKKKMQT